MQQHLSVLHKKNNLSLLTQTISALPKAMIDESFSKVSRDVQALFIDWFKETVFKGWSDQDQATQEQVITSFKDSPHTLLTAAVVTKQSDELIKAILKHYDSSDAITKVPYLTPEEQAHCLKLYPEPSESAVVSIFLAPSRPEGDASSEKKVEENGPQRDVKP